MYLITTCSTECNLQFTFSDLNFFLRRVIFTYFFSIFKTNINVIGCWVFFLNVIYCTWRYDFTYLFTKTIMYPPSELAVNSISIASATDKCCKKFYFILGDYLYSKDYALVRMKIDILPISFELPLWLKSILL